jgi:hypothetical protein
MVVKEHEVSANLQAVITSVTTHFCNYPHYHFYPLIQAQISPRFPETFFRDARKTPRFPLCKEMPKNSPYCPNTPLISLNPTPKI